MAGHRATMEEDLAPRAAEMDCGTAVYRVYVLEAVLLEHLI